MRKIIFLIFSFCIISAGCLSLTGCFLKPYRADIQQGNSLEQKDIDKIQTGMTRGEVKSILGTPMLRNTFDDSCWTYVYTMQKNGGKIQERELILHFSGQTLASMDKVKAKTIK